MPKGAQVLVVHCVDTEGPIGGNVRRRPGGRAEFYDNWPAIERSIRGLTNQKWRRQAADSFGNLYRFNWFIMDFTGFRTNPKRRVTSYHDTYDHFKALPTKGDGFYWHYHHPPATGQGDQWSTDWHSSQEYLNILLHRLVERHDWPEAYRAGGTIEDNEQSHWLEDVMMIDYSNRVSDQSRPTTNIFDFNWHGAPARWGYYHPHHRNFLKAGKMRRFIARSVDLWSRLHVLTPAEVTEAFEQATVTSQPTIISYFSHDHRDMNDETNYAVSLIKLIATRHGIPWRICTALEAIQIAAQIRPSFVTMKAQKQGGRLFIDFNQPIYQPLPWVGAMMKTGQLRWLPVIKQSTHRYEIKDWPSAKKIVVGGTSASGNKFVNVIR